MSQPATQRIEWCNAYPGIGSGECFLSDPKNRVRECLWCGRLVSESVFFVGQKVRAKIDMTNDLREDGMGIEHCASKGDELIIRRITEYGSFAVSHEHITDRAFIVEADEIEAMWIHN